MTVSLILMLGAQAYFLYKLVRLYTPGSREAYSSTRGTLTIFTIVSFLMLFATFAVGLRCFADFDKDLRQAKLTEGNFNVSKRPASTYTGGTPAGTPGVMPNMTERQSYVGGAPLEERMSIE